MSEKLNLEQQLCFVAPKKETPDMVVCRLCKEIATQTREYVQGVVRPFACQEDLVDSANVSTVLERSRTFLRRNRPEPSDLGQIGDERYSFEFTLSSPCLKNYGFRIMTFSYGLGSYPVELTLESRTAAEYLGDLQKSATILCHSDQELERMVVGIISTNRIVGVIQEMIDACLMQQKSCAPVSG